MFIKKHGWAVLYTLLLLSFTGYISLDTFVISRVYTVVEEETEPNSNPPSASPAAKEESEQSHSLPPASPDAQGEQPPAPVVSGDAYQDENISIALIEYREYGTSIYVADIRLSSAEYLQTAFAKGAYGRNVTEKTSETAERNGAILAVNGDYYGSRENGYVIRGGVLYRETAAQGREDLVVYEDGSFGIVSESEVPAQSLLEAGAVEVFSFGPALVVDGAVSVAEGEEVGKAKASNPRTAIGIVDGLHYLFVVSDGRTAESEGLSLYQLAEFMKDLGASAAYNLDGGGSSTMYFNGEVINNPTTNGRKIQERSVSDIVYIGY